MVRDKENITESKPVTEEVEVVETLNFQHSNLTIALKSLDRYINIMIDTEPSTILIGGPSIGYNNSMFYAIQQVKYKCTKEKSQHT